MDNREITQEQISALADGELAAGQLSATFAALNRTDGQITWDLYHQIGDALRSDEMAFSLSPDFAASLSARLEAEPTIIAPVVIQAQMEKQATPRSLAFTFPSIKRFAMSGMAVAATVAAFTFITTPQLMVATKSGPQHGNASPMVVASSFPNTTTNSQETVVLRDPQIDQYLLAHQRFSPSAYSIAQYARSATFATDSDK